MYDGGQVEICSLTNGAAAGSMPTEVLSPGFAALFEERMVGFSRFYAAKGVNEQIDLMIRVFGNTPAHIGQYAVLSMSENDGQYRILQVQHLLDDDGLKVTDLTLSRVDELYAVDTADHQQSGNGAGNGE